MTLALVAISALVLALFDVTLSGSEDSSYFEDFWQSLLRVLDPGTMAGDVGWGRRLLALLVTVFGLLVAGTLIGVIAAGVEDRIERMRRGRSAVFESGHIVVLGASDRLPLLVRQLNLAMAQKRDSAIVVMADRDPTEMQDSVRRVVTDPRGSRLVFRSGDPTHPPDLELVRLQRAAMVIVLADEMAGDARAIRTIIAVEKELGDASSIPVVVELSEPASAEQLTRAYGDDVHPIVPTQAVHRIAAVALREPGAGQVAIALLDDRGSDVHISHVPSFDGLRFFDVVQAYKSTRPIGIMRSDGGTELNPGPEARFGPGDRVILISATPDQSVEVDLSPSPSAGSPGSDEIELSLTQAEQHLLVWGWSNLGSSMLADWANVAAPSSSAKVVLDPASFDGSEVARGDPEGPSFEVVMSGDLSDLAERLSESPPIDTILLCAHPTENGEEEADSRTLLSLVRIRQMLRSSREPHPRVILELLDADNIALADMSGTDDFVVSDAIASQLITQLAEQPDRRKVFLQLYDPNGPSIHLVPAGELGLTGRKRGSEIYQAADRAGVLAIGWRRPLSRGAQLVLNPDQWQQVDLDEDDQIVVIG